MDVRSFEDLECYREAREFRRELSALARGLPKRETYLLADQLLRASRSVTANIAEGYGRHHHQENLQFCRQARGSLTECLDHLGVALDEGYLDQTAYDLLRNHCETCLRLINGYIRYIRNCGGK